MELEQDLKRVVEDLHVAGEEYLLALQSGNIPDELRERCKRLSSEILAHVCRHMATGEKGTTVIGFGHVDGHPKLWYIGQGHDRVPQGAISEKEMVANRPGLIWLGTAWDLVLAWHTTAILQRLASADTERGMSVYAQALTMLSMSKAVCVGLLWGGSDADNVPAV